MSAARRRTNQLPVGRAITRSAKTRSVHEGFQQVDGMRVEPLPVLRNKLRHASQNVRSEMIHSHPRQNQKARIVGQQVHVAPPRFITPAQKSVSHFQVARCTLPGQASNRLPAGFHQILQVLTHGLFIAEVVILLQQAVEQRLLRRAAHLHKLKWGEVAQSSAHRTLVRDYGFGPLALRQTIPHSAAYRWQLDLAGAIERQQ